MISERELSCSCIQSSLLVCRISVQDQCAVCVCDTNDVCVSLMYDNHLLINNYIFLGLHGC